MASKVEVDELAGAGSAGVMTVVGEGGSTTTSLQQGLAKCFCNFNGTSTVAIADSNNIGSLTDNGTGDYHINLTNAHSNTNYSVSLVSGDYHCGHDGNDSASSVNIASYNSSHSNADSARVHGQTFGDLA
jgi:hypothetical protein